MYSLLINSLVYISPRNQCGVMYFLIDYEDFLICATKNNEWTTCWARENYATERVVLCK